VSVRDSTAWRTTLRLAFLPPIQTRHRLWSFEDLYDAVTV
jgi:hypothetical protein